MKVTGIFHSIWKLLSNPKISLNQIWRHWSQKRLWFSQHYIFTIWKAKTEWQSLLNMLLHYYLLKMWISADAWYFRWLILRISFKKCSTLYVSDLFHAANLIECLHRSSKDDSKMILNLALWSWVTM